MTRTTRAELLKLRTARTTYGLAVTVVGITALFCALQATAGKGRNGAVWAHAGLEHVTTASTVALMVAAILGVIVATGEHRHSSATLTYLSTPDRRQVLAAKMAAAAGVGSAYGILAAVTATVIGLALAADHAHHATLGVGALIGHIVGAGLGAAVLAAVGVAVGTVVRSQLAGVIGVLVWCLILESSVGGVAHPLRPYLPYTAASSLGGTNLGAAALGPGYGITHQSALPFAAAAALVIALAALLALVASRTALRSDVA